MKAFKNVKLITKNGVLENKAVVFEKTIISIIDEKDLDSNIESIDGGGNFLVLLMFIFMDAVVMIRWTMTITPYLKFPKTLLKQVLPHFFQQQ